MGDLNPGLYVVATPIGNLGDLSPRAREVLRDAAVIAAEDTRTTGTLLRLAESQARSLSLTEHNVQARIPELLAAAETTPVALVSDAGTPVVADPGARLVEAAHARGIPVFAVPGPSALAAAISVAGFEGTSVHFLGFLPRQAGERRERLRSAGTAASVLVFFESPNRLSATLDAVAEVFGDPETVVCRELTKLHEEVARGPASELARRFERTKGECTVVVRVPAREETDVEAVRQYMAEMQRAGARRSGAAAEAARRFRVAKDVAYALWKEENSSGRAMLR
ncbi:MAG: 16S rRNA (cytidine(1402)-2'-O)-methyltransferase [Dehalococcoidia bacterium]|nr:16S rRNA (cytidine(1402)-2'-O)-methyltransferase [Dehalococcoidia bacterium]